MARSKRHPQFSDADRAAFVDEMQRFHSTTCALLRMLTPGSDDYRQVSQLADAVYSTIAEMSGNNALWTQR